MCLGNEILAKYTECDGLFFCAFYFALAKVRLCIIWFTLACIYHLAT